MDSPSIKIERDVWEALERVADKQHQDPVAMANEALRGWLAEAEQTAEAVRIGVADANAGRVIPHGDVREWLASWGTPGERARPR